MAALGQVKDVYSVWIESALTPIWLIASSSIDTLCISLLPKTGRG